MSTFARVIIAIVVSLLVIFIASIFVFFRSQHSGAEFSPDDFSTRGFIYSKEPTTGWVLLGRSFSNHYTSGPDLVADGFIKPKVNSPKTWHLISDSGNSKPPSADCDARLLIEYLELATDRGENVWDIWNTDYPKLAKVFWPVVAEMARDEAYLVISDVFEFGLDSTITDTDEFKNELDKVTAEAYLKLAKIEFDLANYSRAKSLATTSSSYLSSDKTERLLSEIEQRLADK